MSSINGVGTGGLDINSVMQTIQGTQPQATTGGAFRRIAGALVGGVGNVLMPGVGSAIGNLISGGAGSANSLLGPGAQQALMFQQQMAQETQQFEMATTLIKNRHDSVMSAIRNMKSS